MIKVQILALVLIVALVANFLLLLFVDAYFIWFWVVIIAIGLFAFKALPKIRKLDK